MKSVEQKSYRQKIVPFLWFDDKAEEAVNFYASVFKNSKPLTTTHYSKAGAGVSWRPEWSIMTIDFLLDWQELIALNGGPEFKFTPAISFFVSCENIQEMEMHWKKLSEGWVVLMELDKYSFSERFWWVQDKFGVSWQLNLASRNQKITPFLMFVGDQHGKAEEAIYFYTSLFKDSGIINIEHFGPNEEETEWTVKHGIFFLDWLEFMCMDSDKEHLFTFSFATSFVVNCDNQDEIDELWKRLAEGGEEEQCGWLRDKYGVAWQIIPPILDEMINDPDISKSNRALEAMLKMKKIDINALKLAYENKLK
ncbi:MAG: hypothetical protein ACD_3C00154G0011 [uncultured bacterium (gcode 4)]|uniref:PhnB-like domain-containing protein n=1 Tax=uncultured bacterium (gcode 4) TaxID=1234023 RepID=K2FXQ4_9BACT|nr:MAG: hypothetical protein ACD_3C00154G0011 [uncultured bacterium (gcode 4)]